ncbi:MAG: ester cyclase [Ktedonobacteraceae bacterium]
MSTEDNKAKARRAYEEALNQGKVAVLDELLAPNFLYHNPIRPDVRTLEDYKRFITEFHSAFPDLHVTIDDMIAEDDRVVVRFTWHGTNTGDIVIPTMRLPATGKHVTFTAIEIGRFVEGKAVELWQEGDNLGLFQQLGLIPMPEPVG